jgi:hypothetical protein
MSNALSAMLQARSSQATRRTARTLTALGRVRDRGKPRPHPSAGAFRPATHATVKRGRHSEAAANSRHWAPVPARLKKKPQQVKATRRSIVALYFCRWLILGTPSALMVGIVDVRVSHRCSTVVANKNSRQLSPAAAGITDAPFGTNDRARERTGPKLFQPWSPSDSETSALRPLGRNSLVRRAVL